MIATLLNFWDTIETLTITQPWRGIFLLDETPCCIANQTKQYFLCFICVFNTQ